MSPRPFFRRPIVRLVKISILLPKPLESDAAAMSSLYSYDVNVTCMRAAVLSLSTVGEIISVLSPITAAELSARDLRLKMKLEMIADVPRAAVNDCQEKKILDKLISPRCV